MKLTRKLKKNIKSIKGTNQSLKRLSLISLGQPS